MTVNQAGEPIQEEIINFPEQLSDYEVAEALFMVLDHLGLEAVRTNATESCKTELILRAKT